MPEPAYQEKVKNLQKNCISGKWNMENGPFGEYVCKDSDGNICPICTLANANVPGSSAYNCDFSGNVKSAFVSEAYLRLIKFNKMESKK